MKCPIHNKELKFSSEIAATMNGNRVVFQLYKCNYCKHFYTSSSKIERRKLYKINNIKIFNLDLEHIKTSKEYKYAINLNIKGPKIPCNICKKTGSVKTCVKGCKELPEKAEIRIIRDEAIIDKFVGKFCPVCKSVYVPFLEYKSSYPLKVLNPDDYPRFVEEREQKLTRRAERKKVLKEQTNARKNENIKIEEFKEKIYCIVLLKNDSTGAITKYTISNIEVKENDGNGEVRIPVRSEFGSLCLKAAAYGEEKINYKDQKFTVVDAEYFDNVNLENKNTKNGNNKLIYVYFKLNNSCMRNKHIVDSMTLKTKDIITGKKVDVNVYCCKTCGKYFINYEALQGYFDKQIYPSLKYEIVDSSWGTLKPVSQLMLYGYTVKEGVLTQKERQNTLAAIIDRNLMKKPEIIRNIQSKIDFNGKKKGNEKAKERWKEDILFVSKYGTGKQTIIEGKFTR